MSLKNKAFYLILLINKQSRTCCLAFSKKSRCPTWNRSKAPATYTTLSVGLGGFPSLNWIIFCVVGKNWLQPVQGDRAVESCPIVLECSRATSYSNLPCRKCCLVNNNIRPTRSVVDTPAVLCTSLYNEIFDKKVHQMLRTHNVLVSSRCFN